MIRKQNCFIELMVIVFICGFIAPVTRAVQDPDRDGLESRLETQLGTNPESTDTDGDGLFDYDEYCKYRTDPTKKDSDGDGKPDSDWDERREYTYTIRAICEIRAPSNLNMINDLYQDARPFEKEAALEDARVVEVLIFPFAEAHVYPQPYREEKFEKKLEEYIQPTVSMNYSAEMKEQINHMVEDCATDVEVIEKLLQWLNHETRLVRELPHWEYFHVINGKIVWHKPVGSPARNEQFLATNFLGDSMFKNKVHGTCSSTAIIRGTMFRAAGFPTRLVQTLPLMTRYSEDPEPLADRLRMRIMANGYDWGPGTGGANHTYNEVFLNNRWVRVDNSIGTGPFVGDKLFVKAWSSPDWNNIKEEWNNKRCFRALDVSDAHPKYKEKSAGTIDIAVEDDGLSIRQNANGSFFAKIDIHNKSSVPSPYLRVNFYAGDPDEGGRLLSEHGAGPIMPRSTWGEGDSDLKLKPGENTITIVIDPHNKVAESDETNNKASQVILGKKAKNPETSEKPKALRERYFVRLVVGEDMMTFEGDEVTWEKLPEILAKVPNRDHTVFEIATNSNDDITYGPDGDSSLSPKFELMIERASLLMAQFGFEYISIIGKKPLGSSGSSSKAIPSLQDQIDREQVTKKKQSKFTTALPKVRPAESVESAKVDIAISYGDFLVTRLLDRLVEPVLIIRNNGLVPLPRFHVYFYAGDPDKGGRLISPPDHSAGPIEPGRSWGEGIFPFKLQPGEDTISVVVDPDNKVEELDETNNKVLKNLSEIVSESENVREIGEILKLDMSGNEMLLVAARASEGFNFSYYLFVPDGIDKKSPVHILVEPNNSGMVSDDPEIHQAKALRLMKKSHANKMARRLGVPLLVPTFPRPLLFTRSLTYTHALDIDTLEIEEGKLKRLDLQLTAMIKHAQELLRTNGFKINDKVFMHGFSASAKFCNRYAYLHPEMVKAAAAGGVNGLPTLPVKECNGYELPFPIGLAGIERFASKPFHEKAFMQVAHFIYMGSSDTNDTLHPRDARGPFEAWRNEEADIIRKALAAEKMMPDRWELSRKIYRQQKLNAQLVTYNGVGHSIKSQMLDDVIEFFKANAGEKYVPIKPYEYPLAESKEIRPKSKTESTKTETSKKLKDGRMRHFVRLVVGEDKMTFQGQEVTWEELPSLLEKISNRHQTVFQIASNSKKDIFYDEEKSKLSYSAEFEKSKLRAIGLSSSFGFDFFSMVGVHPLGTKGNPSHVVSNTK